jgi:hypothetical protein
MKSKTIGNILMNQKISRIIFWIMVLYGFRWYSVFAQHTHALEGFEIKGKAYFDYGYLLSSKGPLADRYGDGWNYFKFRRGYFTLDRQFGDVFNFRFRTDADREADDRLRPFVKNLYLEWKNLIPESKLYIGMIPTIAAELSQEIWGYRGIEKLLIHTYIEQTGQGVDFYTADMGFGLNGKVMKWFYYNVIFVNGAGYSHPERDKYKKVGGQLQLRPIEGLILAGYVNAEKQDENSTNYTYKGDVFYKKSPVALGFEIFQYANNLSALKSVGLSMFGVCKIANQAKIFVRYDFYDPFVGVQDIEDDEINYFIAGVDYFPHELVHVMPNIRIKTYRDDRHSDVTALLTFELKY